jgi:DNA ligase-1
MALRFGDLAAAYERLEGTSKGTEMRAILSAFFRRVPKEDIGRVAYLTLGRIASDYEDVNLGMAGRMIIKAIALASGKPAAAIASRAKKLGDLGLCAEEAVGRARKPLTVREVFSTLHRIAAAMGAGSQEAKLRLLAALLRDASPREARYLARIVLGTLRLGVGDKTVLDALAIAYAGGKGSRPALERAWNICPDIGRIAEAVARRGVKGVESIDVMVGRPIQMMLAQRVKTVRDIEAKMAGGDIAAEEKYDGERIQAHKRGTKVTLYSRRLEDITGQFPDVVREIMRNIKARACVIEGEAVAVGPRGRLLPFQTLMQRRRKHGVEAYAKRIPTCWYVFDLLYLDGRSYLRKDYPERHRALEGIVRETRGMQLAKRTVCRTTGCVEDFFTKALERGCEGIIAKSCRHGSAYQAGTRGWLWIKWKPEYAKGLQDTFDLVVVGAYMGRGARAGGWGTLLCAAYNPDADRFETFCKLGSGFTDKDLAGIQQRFRPLVVPKRPARVASTKAMEPDAWFEPSVVVEVLGAEITKSPNHPAAGGLALRFPRFLKYRPDKKPEQATTAREILQMYRKRIRR